MFMIKSLLGKMWGDPQNPEIVQLKAGQLFLVRPDSIKGSRECIFKDAVATVRRTTLEWQFQLVITRAYEEGEAELLDGDAETEDERSFLLDPSLQIRQSSFEGQPSFVWRSLPESDSLSSPRSHSSDFTDSEDDDDEAEGAGELFEFIIDSDVVSKRIIDVFEVTLLQCMFERKFQQSHDLATPNDLDALRYRPSRSQLNSPAASSIYPSTPARLPPPTSTKLPTTSTEVEDELANTLKALSVAHPATTTSSEPPTTTHVKASSVPAPAAAAAPVGLAPEVQESYDEETEIDSEILAPQMSVVTTSKEVDDEETAELPVIFSSEEMDVESGPAEIYLFDEETECFVVQGVVRVLVVEKGDSAFDYWMACYLLEKDQYIISQPINSDMNTRWSQSNLAFIWNFIPSDENTHPTTWSLRFNTPGAYLEFNHNFNRCLWEKSNGMSWGKAKADEKKYVYSAFEDVPMEGVEEEDEESQETERASQELEEEEEEESEEEARAPLYNSDSESESEDEHKPSTETGGFKGKNKLLAVGFNHDRSFIVRGDNIGVFRHTDDDKLKYNTTISKVSTTKGKRFAPSKIMLHDQDRSMILKNLEDPNSLFRMDLETGKVVDEWKVSDYVQVDNFIPDSKYAQTTGQQTLIGHSHNGIFRIDPRLAGNKMVDSQFKQYATKNDFSAATTTESGKIAVASNKGDIRLFDQLGKNAKTALPALGDAILGIDVTADGRWLIATCKTYLLLIDTLIGDGKNKGASGFDKSFPADSKPIPRRLQLKPEHVAYMGNKVSFTPARFNTGLGEDERSIVTSSGEYVITWNFRRVKQGRMDDYQIKRYQDTVVADNFRHGADKNIVVALPDDVFMVSKKQLAKPTRQSLSTPISKLKSRSGIVNSPY